MVSDHEDHDFLRSIVEGADDENKKSNASKPTLRRPLFIKSREHTEGIKIFGREASSLNKPALIEHVPMSTINTF